MYRLRSEVFHHRLGWEVHVEQGREHDWFDLIGPYYHCLVAHQDGLALLGCCRLLPTLGPNMLRDIFPFLLDNTPMPASDNIWEVSRFAINQSPLFAKRLRLQRSADIDLGGNDSIR